MIVSVEISATKEGWFRTRIQHPGRNAERPVQSENVNRGLTLDSLRMLNDLYREGARPPILNELSHSLGAILWPAAEAETETIIVRLAFDGEGADKRKLAALPWEVAETTEGMRFSIYRSSMDGTCLNRFGDRAIHRRLVYMRSSSSVEMSYSIGGTNLPPLADETAELETVEAAGMSVTALLLEELAADGLEEMVGDASILHITAHAAKQGSRYVLLSCSEGDITPVTGNDLCKAIENLPEVRLVVLAACSTDKRVGLSSFPSVAEEVFKAGIPTVIAFSEPILDDRGRSFIKVFYPALLNGTLESALDAVRAKWSGLAKDEYLLRVYSSVEVGHVLGALPPVDEAQVPVGHRRFGVRTSAGVAVVVADEHRGLHTRLLPLLCPTDELPSVGCIVLSERGRVAATVVARTIHLATINLRSGESTPWASVPLDEDARVLGVSEPSYPGAKMVRLLLNLGDAIVLVSAGPGGLGTPERIRLGPCRTALLTSDGHLCLMEDGDLIFEGDHLRWLAGALGAVPLDRLLDLDSVRAGTERLILATNRDGSSTLLTERGVRSVRFASGATLVRPGRGSAREVLVPATEEDGLITVMEI